MNGFLGDDLTRCSFNDVGNLEFSSHHEEDETIIDSSGVVLSDSVLLKQTELIQKMISSNYGKELYSIWLFLIQMII